MRQMSCILTAAYGILLFSPGQAAEELSRQRLQMVAQEIEAAGVEHPEVLKSMRVTPRHEFVPRGFHKQAYFDAALPIGDQQTISPPFVVAYMTQQLNPKSTDRVLEIGTGSGYQAAVLSPLVSEVYTIEIVERLGKRAQRTLRRLGYSNVHVRIGDGYQGWAEHAPYDKIIVTCSPEKIPQPLVDQLREGGQMIIPVGERYQQNLIRVTRMEGELQRQPLRATLFVPMTGTAESLRRVQPNQMKPVIVNGSFEDLVGDSQFPQGWHYLRSAQVEGSTKYLSCTNSEPGQACRALQGLALDGRKISRMRLTLRVRGRELAPGPLQQQQKAAVIVTYYDARRAVIGSSQMTAWEGSFDWRKESRQLRIPSATREAIIRLGLHGGVGKLDLDDIELEVLDAGEPESRS